MSSKHTAVKPVTRRPKARRPVRVPTPHDARDEASPYVLGYLLKSLQHSLRQAMDEALRKNSMSFAHFATLFSVSSAPGTPGAQLARTAFVTAQAMNTILQRLEKDGLILREPHPNNLRADRWYITPSGTRAMQKARTRCAPVLERMVASLSGTETARFEDYLRRCIAGLEDQSSVPTGLSVSKSKG